MAAPLAPTLALFLTVAVVPAQTAWTQTVPLTQPPPRHIHAMAQDPVAGLVMFGGGIAGGPALGDTWVFNASTWTQRTPATSPSPRSGHGMVHDVWRNRVVLFGGATPAINAETWEWDGTNWTRRTPPVSPPARTQFTMAFDLFRGRTVVFGGSYSVADTWEWDGTAWSQAMVANAPSPRCCAAMCCDIPRGALVLFGGYTGTTLLSDTWVYDGVNWTSRSPAVVPPPRCCNTMVHDQLRGRTVMFSGASGVTTGEHGDTWEWNGSDWSNRGPPAAPASRRAYAVAFDWNAETTVLFGGGTYANPRVHHNDTWLYQATFVPRARAFGAGCPGTAGTPMLSTATRPWLGDPSTLSVSAITSSAPVLMALSFSNTQWGTTALPLPLGGLGMPGCSVLVGEGAVLFTTAVTGLAHFALAIPLNPGLSGLSVFAQAFAIDPPANAAGATATAGMELLLGGR